MAVFVKSVNDDPLFFDREELCAIADDACIRQGYTFFKEHRVTEIDQDDNRLWASIEDEDTSEISCDVSIELQDDNETLLMSCSCMGDDGEEVCGHLIAALYAYADEKLEADQRFSASATAIADRVKRARSEVKLESVQSDSVFGVWQAWSESSTTHFPRKYQVTVRSLSRRANLCSCPDFQNNQLGTCKHIEAVLHKIGKRPDFEAIQQAPAPVPYIYLAWDVENAPQVYVHRSPGLSPDLEAILNDNFDAEGCFIRRMPDDFFRFVERVENRSDIQLGEDATSHARHLAAGAAQQLRAEKIRSQIIAGNGKIPGINATLYPYQVEGVAFLAGMGRALLADDMGLGKTLQAISAAVWLKQNEGCRKTLIICPASLKQQWAREIKRFSGLKTIQIQGAANVREVQYRADADFFIINYELVLRDRILLQERLQPDLIIMDEAQRIKNWRTKIATAVKMIPCRYAFVLTGTPLENRLEDLYSLMQVVDTKRLGPLWRYMIDFHITNENGKVLGYRNLSTLRKRLEPVMLRRDRRLVRDQLPDRIVQRLDVELTPPQRDLHDAAMSAAGNLAHIAKRRPLTPSEERRLLSSLQQARMACDAAGLVDKETEGSPKLDELEDLLDELCLQSGLKVVVFSQWARMTEMVEERLRRMGIGSVRLHGGVPTAKRGILMDRFRDDDSVQVFISTDAGGVGLNLQSGAALINLDVPWNPAVLEQRNARIHRLGQTRKVQIITMIATNAYEEQVFGLVKNKQHLFDNVISEDASEDIVGVSKKLLDTLVEQINTDAQGKTSEPETPAPEAEAPEEEKIPQPLEVTKQAPQKSTAFSKELEERITQLVQQLQVMLGNRIERILGWQGGLLVVIDHVDDEADQLAVRLSDRIPIVVIDPITMKGLQRLRAATSDSEDTLSTYYDTDEARSADTHSRLIQQAREKLDAAFVLLEQNRVESALDLIANALFAFCADRAGRTRPFTREEISIWIYSEAQADELLSQTEIAIVMQAVGFLQCPAIPQELIQNLANDAAEMIAD
jgi:superfamily II DNA or RNA helicase